MPYVRRNQRGEIVALHATRQSGAQEELPADHPEILDFLGDPPAGTQPPSGRTESDQQLNGALDDLIALLAERHVIDPDELPRVPPTNQSKDDQTNDPGQTPGKDDTT